MRFSATFLPFFLALATAKEHQQCACHSFSRRRGWFYDWELTKWVCAHDLKDTANYDAGLGRCVANPHSRIDGDRFQRDCIQRGTKDGYRRYMEDGTVDYTGPPILVEGAMSKCQYPTH